MNDYQPLFMEETLLVHIYGSDEEIARFDTLMAESGCDENLVEITLLIEDIKRRNVSKMDWNCCHRCPHFAVCKINWARGERDIPRNCCSLCPNYEDCRARRRRLEARGDGGEEPRGPVCTLAAPPPPDIVVIERELVVAPAAAPGSVPADAPGPPPSSGGDDPPADGPPVDPEVG